MRVSTPRTHTESFIFRALPLALLASLVVTAALFSGDSIWEPRKVASQDVPAMEKDASVLQPGIQEANNLWLMNDGYGVPSCVIPEEGKGCLQVDELLSGVQDSEGLGSWEERIGYDNALVDVAVTPDNDWLESGGRIASCSVGDVNESAKSVGCSTSDDPGLPGTQLGPNGSGILGQIEVFPKTSDSRSAADN